ncbi:uncharacterized protein LOC116300796 [Actinia tenebrosa]|uniref:Uncharacterized protein LOC116300796 n=1 Tax=Actinia tenebrosa TaxID=6105 RepID=A0A6P8IFW0_ACTTE|nr:uncharacterized protein LOC116300796 [Actinia tenebrosa]
MSGPLADEQWLEKNPQVQKLIKKFMKTSDEAIPFMKEYADAVPEICTKLQEWIDNLQVQETAVNSVHTATTGVAIASTVALFTPLAVFGVVGLIGSGVGAAAVTVGDAVSNRVKAKKIKELVESKAILLKKAEEKLKELQDIIKKVSDVGKIPITTANKICFGMMDIARAGAGASITLQGDTIATLFGMFQVWRAGQLAPNGLAVIQGVSGAGSILISGLGAVVGVWVVIDGWFNGNPTKKATIDTKKQLEESTRAILNLINIFEGNQNE